MAGLHHIHLRKRVYKLLEPYPHPRALKRLLDRMMLFISLVGPVATIPQVIQLYTTRDAAGLSLITWSTWVALSSLWFVYGLIHKEPPIWVSNAIYVVLEGAVVAGIVFLR